MANKTTANAFMASAQKSKREMADIQKEGSGKHETDEVELKKISLLIPAWIVYTNARTGTSCTNHRP